MRSFQLSFDYGRYVLAKAPVIIFLFDRHIRDMVHIFFSKKYFKNNIYIFIHILYCLFFLGLFLQNDLTLSLNNPAIKYLKIFNYEILYYEANPGIIFTIGMVVQFINFIYMFYLLIKNYIMTRNKYLGPIIIALFLFFAAAFNDYMVANQIYKFVYMVEYSYLILILTMINLLLNKFVDLKESLARQFCMDTLTDLPNRKKLMMDIENIKNPFVLLINIDSFKEINDFYGNEVGDFVLLEMAARLKKLSVGQEYNLYKMQGDEYAILMDFQEDSTDVKNKTAGYLAQYLFEQINDNTFKYKDHDINVRVTIGVADYSSIQDSKIKEIPKNKVVNNADMVLKEAKRSKKAFLVYSDTMEISREYEKNIFWADKLKIALNNNMITVFFQPIINNKSGKIEKYECLVRMIDTDGKIIGPYNFLDISQKIRLYSQITSTVLKKSFETFKNTDYEFSINLSVKDILNQETNHLIKYMITNNKDIASHVVFEIIESEGVVNYDIMTDFIKDIKAMGCKVAIDDFGSGYSNFEYIIKLNVDYIKIDASIIKNLDKDYNSYIIAKMIVNAARELGLLTIAEFVHSKEVYEKCLELGIDYSQGFYFSEPKDHIEL